MKRRGLLKAFLLSTFLIFSLPSVARAGVITVCASGCDYSSIRTAIANANPGDTVQLAAETFTEGSLSIDKNLTIQGQGAGATIIQPAASQADSTEQIFTVNDNDTNNDATVTIEDLTLRHGKDQGGGAIYNAETLNVRRCTITDNAAVALSGGAIINHGGTLFIDDSTLSNNTAEYHGGAIYNELYAALYVRNSTLSGNRANRDGGGIFNTVSTVHLHFSTVTGNVADADNNDDGDGGGIFNYRPGDPAYVYLYSSIVAGNDDRSTPSADDCDHYLGPLTSMDYNVVGDGTGCPSDKANDQTTSDARLGPLALNGGRTRTHALLSDSPALDQMSASDNDCGAGSFAADQRGKDRPDDTHCDVGAYERQPDEQTAQNASWTPDQGYVFPNVNVHITPTTAITPGLVTVLKRGAYPGLGQDPGELPILWTVTTTATGYTLNMALCYTDGELGNVSESALHAYRWDETTWAWVDMGGSVDADANCVTVVDVTELSLWTLAGGNAPTAVALRTLAAGHSASWVVVLAGVTVAASSAALWRRRRRSRCVGG